VKITSRTLAVVMMGLVSVGFGAGSASAATIDVGLFFMPGGSSGGPPVTPGAGTTSFQLWVDDSNAVGGGAFGIADIKIISNGGLSMNTFAPTTNVNLGIFSLVGNTLTIPNALGITLTAGAFELGTLNVVNAGGAGDITLFSGDYVSGTGTAQTTFNTLPQVLAFQPIPEPGSILLLGVGLGGLGLLIRRSRES
jgi:hypothetical protein